MNELELFNNLLKNYYNFKNNNFISSLEMNILDNNCEYLGISKIALMENAGKESTKEIIKYIHNDNNNNNNNNNVINKIYVFCGTGNNGGDGFVISRHLTDYININDNITVILIGSENKIKTNESKENFKILKNIVNLSHNVEIIETNCINELLSIVNGIKYNLENNNSNINNIIIDSILGTGIKGNVKEPIYTLINNINNLKEINNNKINKNNNLKIISIDCETKGLNSDLIITFHKYKENINDNNNNKNNTLNKTILKKIGIPKIAEYVVGYGEIKALKKPEEQSHKGDNGKVLIIGGSKEYYGAPIITALGCCKLVDLTTILSTKNTINSLKNYPELMGIEIEEDYFNENHIDLAIDYSKKYNTIILGNGLGVNENTSLFVNGFLEKINKLNKKVIIDADAIKVINYEKFNFNENFIFTPHKKEFEYMGINININFNNEDNKNNVRFENIYSTIVLKGHYDIIFNNKKIKINKTGNCAMTKGGTGDLLCGIIGGFASNNDNFISSCAGAFLNGYIGDVLFNELGYYYNTNNMINKIPYVLSSILK